MHRRLLIFVQGGTTLIELVVTIVIVSIAAVTLFVVTSQSTGRSVDPMIQGQAVGIARAYLEEIVQKGFCDPDFDVDADPSTPLDCPADCNASVCDGAGCRHSGSAQEADRGLYDDICDYHDPAGSPVLDQNGNPIPILDSGYRVEVNVVDDAASDLNGLIGNTGRSARIDVTVTHPAMPDDVEISGYRANF